MTVHHKNLQILVTEIFKVKNYLAPDNMKDVLELKEPPYKLRSVSNYFTRRKTTYYGLLSTKHLQPFSKYLRLTLFSMWNSALGGNLISVLQGLFASMDKMFTLEGRLGTRLSFYEV